MVVNESATQQRQAIMCQFVKCIPHNPAVILGQKHHWVYTDEIIDFDRRQCKKGTKIMLKKLYENIEYEIEATIAHEFIETMPSRLEKLTVSTADEEPNEDDEFINTFASHQSLPERGRNFLRRDNNSDQINDLKLKFSCS